MGSSHELGMTDNAHLNPSSLACPHLLIYVIWFEEGIYAEGRKEEVTTFNICNQLKFRNIPWLALHSKKMSHKEYDRKTLDEMIFSSTWH